ncbi:MAG: SUMF1/EgtB/PvdO family nonheme iron enzyme, partial [bacterium]
DGFASIAPVGKFKSNTWNLFDMMGNMAEWVSDWYGPYLPSQEGNPTGPASGAEKVIRGGSWQDSDVAMYSALRGKKNPNAALNTIGFRCAADVRK